MRDRYQHFSEDERMQIETLRSEDFSIRSIARKLCRSPSSVQREINRNQGERGYRKKQSQERAIARRKKTRFSKFSQQTIGYLTQKINDELSPEQISHTMKKNLGFRISHTRIYQFIAEDKKSGGTLYQNLRIANGKKRRKKRGISKIKSVIQGRIGIENRPPEIEKRLRIGDFEADLMVGRKHQGFIVTLVDRKSRYLYLGWVKNKTAQGVADEIVRLLEKNAPLVRTITYDNGKEFSWHFKVNEALQCQSFFARPYHSWERGTNENCNGLIRQYLPKKMDFSQLSRNDLARIEKKLNQRPRKCLDYKTPEEVFLRTG